LEDAMKTPDGLKSWFLSVVDILAKEEMVQCCFVTGLKWAEIDFIADLEFAEKLLAE
jgi:choline kinase